MLLADPGRLAKFVVSWQLAFAFLVPGHERAEVPGPQASYSVQLLLTGSRAGIELTSRQDVDRSRSWYYCGRTTVTSYNTEDEQQVELQEPATSPSLLQFIASNPNVTEEDLISRGTWKFNIKMCDYEKYFRKITTEKPSSSGANQHIAVLMDQMLQMQAVQAKQHRQLLAMLTETLRANTGPKNE
ncbi:hypothetical protein HPB50_007858 [Hyalomma asiaticum]|uniref:Uncharacterized protein n=1 Tax=Hyalomma asiaticum TaxID=266040 RepID=A0ACB7T6T6_HYAAI|nr:hypothetical protein HPB50_007858 [Hyalomma asiaticum]